VKKILLEVKKIISMDNTILFLVQTKRFFSCTSKKSFNKLLKPLVLQHLQTKNCCGGSGVVLRRTPLQPQQLLFRDCCKTIRFSIICLAKSCKRNKTQCFFNSCASGVMLLVSLSLSSLTLTSLSLSSLSLSGLSLSSLSLSSLSRSSLSLRSLSLSIRSLSSLSLSSLSLSSLTLSSLSLISVGSGATASAASVSAVPASAASA
jgi:hypothetical protein